LPWLNKIKICQNNNHRRRSCNSKSTHKKYSEENDTYQVEEAEDGVAGLEKIKTTITIWF
jgi:hypothetical protein